MSRSRQDPKPYSFAQLGADLLFARTGIPGDDRTQLFAQSADVADSSGAEYAAISIDPTSQFRHLVVYFDGEQIGVPLSIGQVIRRGFQKVRVDTLYPACRATAPIGAAWGSPTEPLVCPQVARLRLWAIAPAFEIFAFPEWMVLSLPRLLNALNPAATYIMLAHAPGAKSVALGVSNRNTTQPTTVTVTLFANSSEKPPTDASPTVPNASSRTITTAVAAAAADTNADTESVANDPCTTDYSVFTTAVAGQASNSKLWVFLRFQFHPGM